MKEINYKEERFNRTLHGLDNGLAYYNYEGTHFRVFRSFEDGLKWLESGEDTLVVADFDTDEELDAFLEHPIKLCMDCKSSPSSCGYTMQGNSFYSSLWCKGFQKEERI